MVCNQVHPLIDLWLECWATRFKLNAGFTALVSLKATEPKGTFAVCLVSYPEN